MGRLALSRADRLLLGIVLVMAVLGALVTWLILPPEKIGAVKKLPSTFFNVAYGTKATYQVLDRLEYPVDRLRRPIDHETLKPTGVLFLLQPAVGLDRDELSALEDWIEAGHALVVVPGPPDGPYEKRPSRPNTPKRSSSARGDDSLLEEWFHFTEMPKKPEKLIPTDLRASRSPRDRPPAAGEPLLAGIGELVADGHRRFSPKSPLAGPLEKLSPHVFWKDEQGIVGLRAEFGRGTIIALADTYPLSNLGLSDADNGLLLGNLARELSKRYPGQLAFDEYHLGFAQQDSSAVAIAKLMLVGPWRWAVGQTLLVGILALGAAAVRFGGPRDVTPRRRRQHREFAEAAGRLLDEAGATGLAAETLYHYYRDRLCRLLELGTEADDNRLGQAVRARSGQEIGDLLEQARNAASTPVGRQKLLTLTRKLHRLVETLDHGT
jgi:hypothetical protein